MLSRDCDWIEPSESCNLLFDEMERVMTEHGGIGLAAPQIGVPLRALIACGIRMLNPNIAWRTTQLNFTTDEGCLSCPGLTVPVRRSGKILVEYHTPDGEVKKQRYTGTECVVIQHEMDHLNGRTIADGPIRRRYEGKNYR